MVGKIPLSKDDATASSNQRDRARMAAQSAVWRPRRFVDISAVAEYLNVPVGFIYKHKSQIPHRKLGKYLRFDLEEVRAWLDGNKHGEHSEIESTST